MSSAGPEFRTVGAAADLADNGLKPVYLNDLMHRICVARIDGLLFAFDDMCTYSPCPLSAGRLVGTTIKCQCDPSSFDVRTGEVVAGPASESLNVYDVREADGEIQVRI